MGGDQTLAVSLLLLPHLSDALARLSGSYTLPSIPPPPLSPPSWTAAARGRGAGSGGCCGGACARATRTEAAPPPLPRVPPPAAPAAAAAEGACGGRGAAAAAVRAPHRCSGRAAAAPRGTAAWARARGDLWGPLLPPAAASALMGERRLSVIAPHAAAARRCSRAPVAVQRRGRRPGAAGRGVQGCAQGREAAAARGSGAARRCRGVASRLLRRRRRQMRGSLLRWQRRQRRRPGRRGVAGAATGALQQRGVGRGEAAAGAAAATRGP